LRRLRQLTGGLTVVKIRENLKGYDDPGWYDYPKGTVAYKVAGPAEDGARNPARSHHDGHGG
jgi:hypothetical protein